MNVHFASIGHKPEAVNDFQRIPADEWTLVRFPYGGEFSDDHRMHNRRHRDAYVVQDWTTDPRSGLLWPSVDGVGCLELNIHWHEPSGTRLRTQFSRNPLGLPGAGPANDTTATQHWPVLGGAVQCVTGVHWLKVQRGVPLGVRVQSSGAAGLLAMAQLKLAIMPTGRG